jgi:hypothetical protein
MSSYKHLVQFDFIKDAGAPTFNKLTSQVYQVNCVLGISRNRGQTLDGSEIFTGTSIGTGPVSFVGPVSLLDPRQTPPVRCGAIVWTPPKKTGAVVPHW